MKDQVRIVQFLHPGPEHRPDGNAKPWNQGIHRRTFVEQEGRFVNSPADSPKAEKLHFWCEWEAQAALIRELTRSPGYPRYLFQPELRRPRKFDNHANTDPCVFGDRFRYCVCQQPSRPSLKKLPRGSLLLFGSYLGGKFVMDTAFVVAESQPYDRSSYRRLGLPRGYIDVGLAPIMAGAYCGAGDQFQLYEGATWEQPVKGMFSFFPCQPARDGEGFPRPNIVLPPYVNQAHRQGIKSTLVSLAEMQTLWRKVVDQVLQAELKLGVQADLP